jgi:DNA-binding response OmpR family regulator
MTKILLVEDDNNLREIYGTRLEAEGYSIFSAGDGEEALATAVREHPDLIITDVMMPKISGFDMLDILRSTPETQNIKVIVMTALSQDDDKQRGKNLGADHYIVKSQVTLEDVVNVVKEVLNDSSSPVISNTISSNPNASKQPTTDTQNNPEQSVEDFVSNSPLMNGTPPTSSASTNSSSNSQSMQP